MLFLLPLEEDLSMDPCLIGSAARGGLEKVTDKLEEGLSCFAGALWLEARPRSESLRRKEEVAAAGRGEEERDVLVGPVRAKADRGLAGRFFAYMEKDFTFHVSSSMIVRDVTSTELARQRASARISELMMPFGSLLLGICSKKTSRSSLVAILSPALPLRSLLPPCLTG